MSGICFVGRLTDLGHPVKKAFPSWTGIGEREAVVAKGGCDSCSGKPGKNGCGQPGALQNLAFLCVILKYQDMGTAVVPEGSFESQTFSHQSVPRL